MPEFIQIEVTGIDKIVTALNKFPQAINKNFANAGKESAKKIWDTQGLKNYPPVTAANASPEPYYIRGRGMQTKSGNRGGSEKLKSQFYAESSGMNTTIGNRASYADYVVGEGQAKQMSKDARIPKGWRKLYEVAEEKKADITRIYQGMVDYTIKQLGL